MTGDIDISPQALAATLAGQASDMRAATEEWLESLNVKLIDVWFFARGEWVKERHVADEDTLPETIDMARSRIGATYAVYCNEIGKWVLRGRVAKLRLYDTKEAAEMVAIHNG